MSDILDELSIHISDIKKIIIHPREMSASSFHDFNKQHEHYSAFFYFFYQIMDTLDRLSDQLASYDQVDNIPDQFYEPYFVGISETLERVRSASHRN